MEKYAIGEGCSRERVGIGAIVSVIWTGSLIVGAVLVATGIVSPRHYQRYDSMQPPSVFPLSVLDQRTVVTDLDDDYDMTRHGEGSSDLLGPGVGEGSPGRGANGGGKESIPVKRYVFGTDLDGHSILDCLLVGLPRYLFFGTLAALTAAIVGTALGSIIGYVGGVSGCMAQGVCDVVATFPRIILLILVIALWNSSLGVVLMAAGLLAVPRLSELIADRIEEFKNSQFVEAARELGLGHARILLFHLLWKNLRGLILTQMTYVFAEALLLESTLAYLGFGEPESWGSLAAVGKENILDGAYWIFGVPALAIASTILAFQWVGDELAARFHPRRLVT